MKSFFLLVLPLPFLFPHSGNSETPLQLSSGINFQSTIGFSDKLKALPFNWSLSGQLTTTIKGWSLPFSGSYSNKTFSYTHPFNKICVSPKYKWIELKAGYCSLSWSPLILSGETFLGAAFELSPSHWKIKGFYGRFRKEIILPEVYLTRRTGGGFSAGYSKKGFEFIASALKIQDMPGEQGAVLAAKPETNLATEIQLKIALTKKLALRYEQALSTLLSGLLLGTKAGFNYRGKFTSWAVDYQRIDPGYRTLGASFISNDLEGICFTLTQSGSSKLKYNYSVNASKNNIQGIRSQNTYRLTQNIGIGYQWKNGISAQLSYGNFATHNKRQIHGDSPEPASESAEYSYNLCSSVSSGITYRMQTKTSLINLSLQIQQNAGREWRKDIPIHSVGELAKGKPNHLHRIFRLAMNSTRPKKKISSGIYLNLSQQLRAEGKVVGIASGFTLVAKNKTLNWSFSPLINHTLHQPGSNTTQLQEKAAVSCTLSKKPRIQSNLSIAFSQSMRENTSGMIQNANAQFSITSTF